jgi:4-hydroxy-3-polyprenylbenzoate decarboxylase
MSRDGLERLVIAISGASGSRYAALLLQHVVTRVPDVAVVLSSVAPRVIVHELGLSLSNRRFDPALLLGDVTLPPGHRLKAWGIADFSAPFASGSNACDAMVIVPASQGLIGRIAAGVSDCLITRAADVCLKERRPLIVVPREAPLSLIHLRNWTTLTEAGAVVLPACPSFYGRPETVEAVMMTVVDRILAHLGLGREGAYHWGEDER